MRYTNRRIGLLYFTLLLLMFIVLWVGLSVLVTFVSSAKRLNRSRCDLGLFRWGRDPKRGRGNFGGCPTHWKALGVIDAALYEAHKPITVTAGLRQPRAMVQTSRCHITLSPVKNPPLRCGLSSKFFDHLLYRVARNGSLATMSQTNATTISSVTSSHYFLQ